MLHWIAHLVGAMGYLGVALLMAIENVILPLPSELIMPLAGFNAAQGRITLWGAILAGTVGSVVGAFPIYIVARILGEETMMRWVERHGAWLFLRPGDLKKAQRRFQRHGGWAVFLGQLLPGVRGLISLPAGFARMNFVLFAAANFAGTVIWCAVLAILGNLLGANYRKIHHIMRPLTWVVLAVLLAGGAVWLIRRRRSRQRT